MGRRSLRSLFDAKIIERVGLTCFMRVYIGSVVWFHSCSSDGDAKQLLWDTAVTDRECVRMDATVGVRPGPHPVGLGTLRASKIPDSS